MIITMVTAVAAVGSLIAETLSLLHLLGYLG